MISKYSFGIGDRFAHQGKAQLRAFQKALELGTEITPVWNKSHREHNTVNSDPSSVRMEADQAVRDLNWRNDYLVDADHINLENVDGFIASSDFFTIDVAKFIGAEPIKDDKIVFKTYVKNYRDKLFIPGIEEEIIISEADIDRFIDTFLQSAKEAGIIYNYIRASKSGNFVTEVSMDEVESPQTPVDLFFILAALSYYKVPVQTIAPKFTGRFNKGVDYEGDTEQFKKEFEEDLLVIKYAIAEFGLPSDLKLSVHTGSDKFSLYPIIRKLIQKHNCGLHLKTAGTTWLEELIGMAETGEEPLSFAKSIYSDALKRYKELTSPYSTVLSVSKSQLPSLEEVSSWSSKQYVAALTHNQEDTRYNPHFRQLLHTAYKVAAEHNGALTKVLEVSNVKIERNVTYNIFERHIKPLFIG